MQLDYSQNPAVGFAGMRADTGRHNEHVVSRVNPAVVIPLGRFVTKGTADRDIKLPTTAAEVTAGQGVAIQDWASENTTESVPSFPLKSAVPVLKQGRVWVTVEEAVVAGDDVYVRYASGAGGTGLGSFRKSADTTTAGLVPGARYETSAAASGLAIVVINMP